MDKKPPLHVSSHSRWSDLHQIEDHFLKKKNEIIFEKNLYDIKKYFLHSVSIRESI